MRGNVEAGVMNLAPTFPCVMGAFLNSVFFQFLGSERDSAARRFFHAVLINQIILVRL